MPEDAKDYLHIIVRKDKEFEVKTYQTIILSATKGIKAIKGKLKETDETVDDEDMALYIQSYLFEKSKGWSMKKAKAWLEKKKNEKEFVDIGLSKTQIELLMPMKTSKEVSTDRIIEGYATMSSFNRNGYHVTNDAFSDTLEEFMENPVLLFMHMSSLVIGSVLELKVDKVGVFVKAQLMSEGKSTVADDAWNAIEEGSLKAFSIGFLVLAFEKVCMEKQMCFWSITEGELVELSVVSVPAVRGSYFKVVNDAEKAKTDKLFITTSIDGESLFPYMSTDNTSTDYQYWWMNDTSGNDVIYDFELDDNINVTQIIVDKEEKDKVKLMENETPEPSTEIERVEADLSSTENNDELLAKLDEVLEIKNALKAEQAKLKEQNLDLLVKKTMTLFESVENKADIKPQLVAIVKNGGEVALTATIEIIKSVMESKIIIDDSLTDSGGEGISAEDKLSKADFGKTVDEMVAEMASKPIAHEIKAEGF